MTCEELSDLYELYALGLLDPVEKEEADAHLERGCETCRRNLTNALAVNTMLMSLSAESAPPKRLKHRVMASVGVERSGWGWAAMLAAVCMLVVALWLSTEERQRAADLGEARASLLKVSAERDRMQQALSFLNQPETRQVGFGKGEPAPPRGNVFVNPRSGVLMIASNLPKLAPGKTFEMWIVPKGGAPRPAGLFQPDASGAAFHILAGPVDLAEVSAVAVTVEPEAGSAAPTMPIIIVAPIAGP